MRSRFLLRARSYMARSNKLTSVSAQSNDVISGWVRRVHNFDHGKIGQILNDFPQFLELKIFNVVLERSREVMQTHLSALGLLELFYDRLAVENNSLIECGLSQSRRRLRCALLRA